MIPQVPFPHDIGLGRTNGLEFKNHFTPKGIRDRGWISSCSNGLSGGFAFPGDDQDISVWQRLDIVMLATGSIGNGVTPRNVSDPIYFFDYTAFSTGIESCIVGIAGVEQRAIREEVHRLTRLVEAVPGMHFLAAFVDEVGSIASYGSKEDVTVIEGLGKVLDQAHGLSQGLEKEQ